VVIFQASKKQVEDYTQRIICVDENDEILEKNKEQKKDRKTDEKATSGHWLKVFDDLVKNSEQAFIALAKAVAKDWKKSRKF